MNTQNMKVQKKHRFNIVDLVLIVTLIAAVAGIAIRYNLASSIGRAEDTALVTVVVRDLKKDFVSAVVEGDTYYYQQSGNPFGVLKQFETKPAKGEYTALDGTAGRAEYANRVDVYAKIEISGYHTDGGFMVGGTSYVGCGSSVLIRSPHLETEFLVLDIQFPGK